MKEKYLQHIQQQKEDCKQHIMDIVNEQNGFKFRCWNLICAINRLKEIESIEEFLYSDDFELIEKR